MRVSMFQKFDMARFNMNQIQLKEVKLQTQISTGKSFQKMSEAPIEANQSLMIRQSLSQIDQYQKNVNDASSVLEAVEANLGSVVLILQEAREQGLKSSSGTFTQENKDTMASVIDQNIAHIVSIANTKHLGKQLFAGEKTQTRPFEFDGAVLTYNGDLNVPSIKVSPSLEVPISINGEDAFRGVVESLIQLRDSVLAGDSTNIQASISSMDTEMNKFIDLRSEVGVRMQTMDMYTETYNSEAMNLEIKQSNVEDVDFTKVMMDFANVQRIHQGVLASSQKMFSISLLNYM